MIRRPPGSTGTDPRFPSTTLFRFLRAAVFFTTRFLAAVLRAVLLRAAGLRAVVLRAAVFFLTAVFFLAAVFPAVVLRAAVLRAVVRRAVAFRARQTVVLGKRRSVRLALGSRRTLQKYSTIHILHSTLTTTQCY